MVQLNISARHGHLGAATQDKIKEKVEKLKRFYDRISAIRVTADLEKHDSINVEILVSAGHTSDFVASESASELFVALDSVVHKLEQQLRKHKQKIQTGHRQPGRKQSETPIADELE